MEIVKLPPYLIGAILAVALISPPPCAAANRFLQGSVRFKAGSFVVENRSQYYWENCDLLVNPDDENFNFSLEKVDIVGGDVTAFPASKFSQPYPAVKYNPQKHPPLVMRIACDIDGHRIGQDFEVND